MVMPLFSPPAKTLKMFSRELFVELLILPGSKIGSFYLVRVPRATNKINYSQSFTRVVVTTVYSRCLFPVCAKLLPRSP